MKNENQRPSEIPQLSNMAILYFSMWVIKLFERCGAWYSTGSRLRLEVFPKQPPLRNIETLVRA